MVQLISNYDKQESDTFYSNQDKTQIYSYFFTWFQMVQHTYKSEKITV
jgi:hypothetical protein